MTIQREMVVDPLHSIAILEGNGIAESGGGKYIY